MKRITILAAAVLGLTASTAFAQQSAPAQYPQPTPAQPAPPASWQGGSQTGGESGSQSSPWAPPAAPKESTLYMYRGDVVSVDAAAGTVTAEAARLTGPCSESYSESVSTGPNGETKSETQQSSDCPQPTGTYTFTVGADSKVIRNGQESGVGSLRAGDLLHVAIFAGKDASESEVLATPVLVASAFSYRSIYGFGGRVRSVDEGQGTITLDVRFTTASARRALGSDEGTLTFKVGPSTRVMVDGGTKSLGSLQVGDTAGVASFGGRNQSLDEILSTPVDVVMGLSEGKPTEQRSARLAKAAVRKTKRINR